MGLMQTQRLSDLTSLWDEIESKYRANMYDGDKEFGSARLITSTSRILLTAPHSVNHFRYGKVKWADRWTGGLCELIAKRAVSNALIPDGPIPSWEQWEDRTDLFAVLLRNQHPLVVLDVHGMSDKHEVDVCMGHGPAADGRSIGYARAIQAALEADGYIVSVNHPFDAVPPFTVTAYEQIVLETAAIQIEIRAGLRDPASKPELASRFLLSFESAIRSLEHHLNDLDQ